MSRIQSISVEIEPTDYRDNENYQRGREAAIAFKRGIAESSRRKWEEMSARIMIAQQKDPVYQRAILRAFARLRRQRKLRKQDNVEKMPT